jgi:hypothetical protein
LHSATAAEGSTGQSQSDSLPQPCCSTPQAHKEFVRTQDYQHISDKTNGNFLNQQTELSKGRQSNNPLQIILKISIQAQHTQNSLTSHIAGWSVLQLVRNM